jgi:hypothetical protein
MHWPLTRRLFLKNCVLLLTALLALLMVAQFAFFCGQLLASLTLEMFRRVAPELHFLPAANGYAEQPFCTAAGYALALVAILLSCRFGWRRLAAYEDLVIRGFVHKTNRFFTRR